MPGSPLVPLRPPRVSNILIGGVFVLLLLQALVVGKTVLAPIVVAVFLALVLSPLVRGLDRFGLPTPVSAALVMLGLLAILGAGLYALAQPAEAWLKRAPETIAALELKLRQLIAPIEGVRRATERVGALAGQRVTIGESLEVWIFTGTGRTLAGLALMFLLIFYLLAFSRQTFRDLVRVLPNHGDRRRAFRIGQRVQRDLSHYLATLTLINIGQGVSIALICYFCGLPNPILWGAITVLLNYMHVIGPLAVQLMVFGVALWSFDEPTRILVPPLLALISGTIEGQIITPNLMAWRLTLNPIVLFLSLLFWGWLWGIPGALLAVPILMIAKVTCDAIPSLVPLGRVLGRSRETARRGMALGRRKPPETPALPPPRPPAAAVKSLPPSRRTGSRHG